MRIRWLLLAISVVSTTNTSTSNGHDVPKAEENDNAMTDQSHRNLRCRTDYQLEPFPEKVKAETVISWIALGDTPYSLGERYCLNRQLRDLDLSRKKGPSFMIHIGDIKEGSGRWPCDEEAYNDIAEIFSNETNAANYDVRDLFFVPGDNEWIDCRNREKAWGYWMENFGPGNKYGFGTFSSGSVSVERQNDTERLPGVPRSENFAFFRNKILFIGLNIVGGKNEAGDEDVRLVQNFYWTKDKLSQYSRKGMKAAVLFAHAPPKEGSVNMKYFGEAFYALLRKKFSDLPVMYLRGDSHTYCVRYPDTLNPNVVDVEVDGGGLAPPIMVSIQRNPANDKHIFVVDRRGGLYDPPGECRGISEQTWKSPPAKLTMVGDIKKNPDVFPLSVCHGHCKKDIQCQPGLSCFVRNKKDEPVPGCDGTGKSSVNYCYAPDSVTAQSHEKVKVPEQTPTEKPSKPENPKPTALPALVKPTRAPGTRPTNPLRKPTISPRQKKIKKITETPPRTQQIKPTPSPTTDVTTKLRRPSRSKPTGTRRSKKPRRPSWSKKPSRRKRTSKPTFAVFAAPKPTKKPITHPTLLPPAKTKSKFPELRIVGKDPLYEGFKFGLCEGSCRKTDECQEGLLCMKRKADERVPGCSGVGRTNKDYCYSPLSTRGIELTLYGSPKENPDKFPLRVCEGDCDGDGQCMKGLKCFQRNETEEVPGCIGKGKKGKDYCYDPRGIVIPPTPTRGEQPTSSSNPILAIDNSSYPLGQCIGDCDRNTDCELGLLCFKREGTEPVPGCEGAGVFQKDYCYTPPRDVLVELGNDGSPVEAFPLDRCRGDCDSDDDCMPGLTCFSRQSYESVPGCRGQGISGIDYCI